MSSLHLDPAAPDCAGFAYALREIFGPDGLEISDAVSSTRGDLTTVSGNVVLLGAVTPCTLLLEKHGGANAAFCLAAKLSAAQAGQVVASLWPRARANDASLSNFSGTTYVATSGWGRTYAAGDPDPILRGVTVPVGSGVSLIGAEVGFVVTSLAALPAAPANSPFPQLGTPAAAPQGTLLRRHGAGLLLDRWWLVPNAAPVSVHGMQLHPTWYGYRRWLPDVPPTSGADPDLATSALYGLAVGGHVVPVGVAADGTFELDEWVRLRLPNVKAALDAALPANWHVNPQLVEAIAAVGDAVTGELYGLSYRPGGVARVRARLHSGSSASWSLGLLPLSLESVVIGVTCRPKRYGDRVERAPGQGDDDPGPTARVTDEAPTGDHLAIDVTASVKLHGARFRLRWDGTRRTASLEVSDPQAVDIGGFFSSLVGAELPFGLDTLRLDRARALCIAETRMVMTEVGLQGAVELIPDLVTLTRIGFTAKDIQGLGLRIGVYTALQIGGASLACSGVPNDGPGWLLSASLDDTTGIDVTRLTNSVLGKVGLSLPGAVPSLVISSLGAAHDTGVGTTSLGARIALGGMGWDLRLDRGSDKRWSVQAELTGVGPTVHPDALAHSLQSLLPTHGVGAAAPPVPSSLFSDLLPTSITLKAARLGFDLGARAASAYAEVDVRLASKDTTLSLQVDHPGPQLGWSFRGAIEFDAASPPRLGDIPAALGLDGSAGLVTFLDHVTVGGLTLSYDTLTHTRQASINAAIDATPISFSFAKSGGATDISGHAEPDGARLDVRLHDPGSSPPPSQGATTFALIAAFDGGATGGFSPTALIRSLAGGSDEASAGGLDLRRGAVVVWKEGTVKRYCLMADLDVHVELSGLKHIPVLGEHLPDDLSVGAGIHLAFATAQPPADLSGVVGDLLPVGFALPAAAGGADSTVTVRLGNRSFQIGAHSGAAPAAGGTVPASPPNGTGGAITGAPPSLQPQTVTWLEVDKSLGPIHLRRVGAGVDTTALQFRVDGGVSFAGLTVGLEGLGVDYHFADKSVTPALSGIDLGLVRGPVEIAASFGRFGDDYVGAGFLHTASFGLTVVGAVGEVSGALSLFLFGALSMPLGGPPFLFVDGLSVGFGLNRHLDAPDASTLDDFALLQVAKGSAPIDGLAARLEGQIHPSVGEYFFAVGFQFTSFKVVKGVALALAEVDAVRPSFRLDVLASAELSSPPGLGCDDPSAVAWVELDIVGSVIPAEGEFIVHAELSPKSFAVDRACHLHGGFAAACWAAGAHAGDFVISLGGYHPAFSVPSHYPVPSRVGADWQLGPLAVSGALYYALTPRALMCGVSFHATWDAGPFGAWFDFGVDFLMQFKPLHFEGDIHIEIGASVDLGFLGTITVSAGAELHLSGPDFSGHGYVSLCSFHLPLSFGHAPGPPPGLAWAAVATDLLGCPAAGGAVALDGLISCTAISGLRGNQGDRWIVNPHAFELAIECGVPCGAVTINGDAHRVAPSTAPVLVGPMFPTGAGARWAGADLDVKIARDGVPDGVVVPAERTRPFPTALFATADLHARLADLSAGLTLSPPAPRPGQSRSFDPLRLTDDGAGVAAAPVAVSRLFAPQSASASLADWEGIDADVKAARDRLSADLGRRASTRPREVGGLGGSLLDPPTTGHSPPGSEVRHG